jgi:hypothetical protein
LYDYRLSNVKRLPGQQEHIMSRVIRAAKLISLSGCGQQKAGRRVRSGGPSFGEKHGPSSNPEHANCSQPLLAVVSFLNATLHTTTWHRFHKKQFLSALTDGVLPVRTHPTRATLSSTPTLPGWTSSPRMAARSLRVTLSSRPRRSPSVFPRA